MNCNHFLAKKLQYDYLRNVVRKRKRFSKWDKKVQNDDIDVIKTYFGYSTKKAIEVLSVLSKNDIKKIRESIQTGGVR